MSLDNRINAFIKLGEFLGQFSSESIHKKENILHNDLFFESFKNQIKLAKDHNGWFTINNIVFTFNEWSNALTKSNLNTWLDKYNINIYEPKRVAVIMAGNIPLVGFHDFLSVLITGHHVIVKQSSNDKQFLPIIAKYLEYIEPEFKGRISFTEGKLNEFDAVIATGSDNTARYFEYYFKGKPSIIRKNRNSVAVLTNTESEAELKLLSEDIFRYYGLGCRNVSKLFVPREYDFDDFFKAVYHWHPIINEIKYANNYDYNKAVYLMSEFDIQENGFIMVKEDKSYSSPIATLFFEYYDTIKQLSQNLELDKDKIQCIVSKGITENEIEFGQTQKPKLWDYADNIDTLKFLLKI
ncbi:MAG: acyl-CoA reductase [Bacteroidetes bacterium]|nr:acyl-CoA reductase [Bacteroidota bacterium]